MTKVTNLEEWKTVKIALRILEIVKSIYGQVVSLCEMLRTESSLFITEEMEELIELAYEQLGINNSEDVQSYLYDYLLDDLSLDEFIAIARKKSHDTSQTDQTEQTDQTKQTEPEQ